MVSAVSSGGFVGELPETSCVQYTARPCHRDHPRPPTPCHKYKEVSKHWSCFIDLHDKAELADDHQTNIGRF